MAFHVDSAMDRYFGNRGRANDSGGRIAEVDRGAISVDGAVEAVQNSGGGAIRAMASYALLVAPILIRKGQVAAGTSSTSPFRGSI